MFDAHDDTPTLAHWIRHAVSGVVTEGGSTPALPNPATLLPVAPPGWPIPGGNPILASLSPGGLPAGPLSRELLAPTEPHTTARATSGLDMQTARIAATRPDSIGLGAGRWGAVGWEGVQPENLPVPTAESAPGAPLSPSMTTAALPGGSGWPGALFPGQAGSPIPEDVAGFVRATQLPISAPPDGRQRSGGRHVGSLGGVGTDPHETLALATARETEGRPRDGSADGESATARLPLSPGGQPTGPGLHPVGHSRLGLEHSQPGPVPDLRQLLAGFGPSGFTPGPRTVPPIPRSAGLQSGPESPVPGRFEPGAPAAWSGILPPQWSGLSRQGPWAPAAALDRLEAGREPGRAGERGGGTLPDGAGRGLPGMVRAGHAAGGDRRATPDEGPGSSEPGNDWLNWTRDLARDLWGVLDPALTGGDLPQVGATPGWGAGSAEGAVWGGAQPDWGHPGSPPLEGSLTPAAPLGGELAEGPPTAGEWRAELSALARRLADLEQAQRS